MGQARSGDIHYARIRTRSGAYFAAASRRGVVAISLTLRNERAFVREVQAATGVRPVRGAARLRPLERELRAYFSGRLRRFSVPVDLSRLTPFQRAVLKATARIPFGRVASYGEVAARIGKRGASRAVGGALGANPVPIVVPCHRVIASDGSLGGFGGGLGLKRRLLRAEGSAP